MLLSRRHFAASISLLLVPQRVLAQPKVPATPWLEFIKVVGDVGESLYTFVDAMDKLTELVVWRTDWFQGRGAKVVLTALSKRLSILIADQGAVTAALDQYGNTWRAVYKNGDSTSPAQIGLLQQQWRASVVTLRKIGISTQALLADVRGVDGDIVLDEAYLDLQSALRAKVGILDRIARQPPPATPGELHAIVAEEETFIRMRVAAKDALISLNAVIKKMSAAKEKS